jgi:hypothetical protein
VSVGEPVIDLLLCEALAKRKKAAFRVEIFNIIERLGLPLNASQIFRLMSARLYLDPWVAARAVRLVFQLKNAANASNGQCDSVLH